MKRRKQAQWNRLDNAAKIFPSTSNQRDTKVFRFACQLFEPIDEKMLQNALETALETFPVYRSVLRRGLFWYYLESSLIRPVAEKENKPPCSPLYDRNRKSLLFQVTYFGNRINLEVYHALSDATGALQFFKCIIFHYITTKHAKDFTAHMPVLDYDASNNQKADDSFKRYYTKGNEKKFAKAAKKKRVAIAYRIKGTKTSENRLKVIEGIVKVESVMVKARAYKTSLSVFLGGVLLQAIHEDMAMRDKKRPVVLSIPVNLRKHFQSQSARNFFSVIDMGYDFQTGDGSFEDMIATLDQCLKSELTIEKLKERINALSALENNALIRVIPLGLKDIVLRFFHYRSAKGNTATLSNVGKVSMPDELNPYIELFDVFVSTNKLQVCLCSFQELLTITFISSFVSTDIQKRFFRTLTDMGIEIDIYANPMNEE